MNSSFSFAPRRFSTVAVCAGISAFAAFVAPATAYAAPPARVYYTVAVADIPNKTYHVTARAEGVTDKTVSFALPGWTPGWYVLTSAEKNLSNVTATDDDKKPLPLTHPDKLTWQVASGDAKNVTLSYDLKATDTGYGFFAPYLDKTNGFVPGPASLVYVTDGKTAPCSITYRVPDGWQIASANEPTHTPGMFNAPDYDTLIDQPADLGTFRRFDKTIKGAFFSVVMVGSERAPDEAAQTFADSIFKTSEAGITLMGGAPFPRYIYHLRFPRNGGGSAQGLEHLNGTVIAMPPLAIRNPLILASLMTHEFFHAWNVKRIRPEKLGPFDYTQAVRVKELWWFEGVTEYYAPKLVTLAGLSGRDYWLGYMAKNLGELQNNPARKTVTLETASLKAWEGESEGFGGLSYYNKGMVVGLLIDIEMRKRTDNKVGLDDLTRDLFAQTQKSGKGLEEGAIEKTASRLTNTDMTPFFALALRSTDELPLAETLAAAGLTYKEDVTEKGFLGVSWDYAAIRAEGAPIASVVAKGPAARAGLKAGDVITAVDGRSLQDLFGPYFAGKKPGDTITLTVRKPAAGSEPRTVVVTMGKNEERTVRLTPVTDATPLQQAVLAAISGTKTAE